MQTGISSIINTTIYPDKYSAKEGLDKRTDWLKGYKKVIADTLFYEEDVTFATHKKNSISDTLGNSKNHVSEHSRLESLEREVKELKSMICQLLEVNKK